MLVRAPKLNRGFRLIALRVRRLSNQPETGAISLAGILMTVCAIMKGVPTSAMTARSRIAPMRSCCSISSISKNERFGGASM